MQEGSEKEGNVQTKVVEEKGSHILVQDTYVEGLREGVWNN